MNNRPERYTLNGGESRLSTSLLHLEADTQERAQRVLELGAAAHRYAILAALCAAYARKERVSK